MSKFTPMFGATESVEITPALVEQHYRLGRRLQGEAFARMVTRGFRFLTGGAKQAEAQREAAHTMTSSLAAIRSTAEILRDNPDMAAGERKRFLGALLEEEARLERLVPRVRLVIA